MLTAGPGQTITISQDDLPTGLDVGFQVIKAATGAIVVGRSTTGVFERPTSSGNYVATFVTPVEADLYLIVMDWSGGTLSPSTSVVQQLQVTSMQPAETGLGPIADYAKLYLGGETYRGIVSSPTGGEGTIALAIGAVKARVFTSPPITAAESLLPQVVISYLGKLVALELMPAARDYWNTQYQSESTGSDPTEIATFPSRQAFLNALATDLLAKVRADWPIVLPLIESPMLRSSANGPQIDEDDESRYVTRDPRHFPLQDYYPYSKFDKLVPPGVVSR